MTKEYRPIDGAYKENRGEMLSATARSGASAQMRIGPAAQTPRDPLRSDTSLNVNNGAGGLKISLVPKLGGK